jgi:hypothetical protein
MTTQEKVKEKEKDKEKPFIRATIELLWKEA